VIRSQVESDTFSDEKVGGHLAQLRRIFRSVSHCLALFRLLLACCTCFVFSLLAQGLQHSCVGFIVCSCRFFVCLLFMMSGAAVDSVEWTPETFAEWVKQTDPARPDEFIKNVIEVLNKGDVFSPEHLCGLDKDAFNTELATPGVFAVGILVVECGPVESVYWQASGVLSRR